ncbi:MAG: hypothetical protein ACXVCP_00370 [Bdellovibrio sp.]
MKHELPRWFYHKEAFPEGKIIRTEEEFKAMPEGFVLTPADFEKEEIKIEAPKIEIPKEEKAPVDFESMTEEELIVEAMKNGITKKKAKAMSKEEIIEHIKGAA